jgi:hypothetical protein
MTYDAAADAASATVGFEPNSGIDRFDLSDHSSHYEVRSDAPHHLFHPPGQHQAGHHDAGSVTVHLDAAGAEIVQVPDPALLFTGHYRHAGPDLVIAGDDGHQILITDYFSGGRIPSLMAPNGATLSAELVMLLAGPAAPDHYAQAAPAAPSDPIGRAEKITGTVTVIRNGVPVALNSGDAVYKSDVIQTGGDSSCGISFPDGTALNLVGNTRMALNDYAFDPNGSGNVALISLVQGTFAFVAGQVAHTGDMKIETPVATMGIRGTTGTVQEVATISADLGGVTYSFTVTEDYGTGRVGNYVLTDQNGNVIATVSQNGYVTFVSPQGPNLPPLVSTQPMNNSQVAFEQQIIQQVFQTLLQGNPGLNQNQIQNPNTQPGNSSPGSSTPPDQLHNLPQLLQNGTQQPVNVAVTGANGTITGTVTVTSATSNTPTTTGPGDLTVTTGTTTISSNETVDNLTVGAGAVLDIVSPGSLTVLGSIDDFGTIKVTTTAGDPLLQVAAPVTVEKSGVLEATGVASSQVLVDNILINAGTVLATDHGVVTLQYETVTNTGTIEASAGGTVNFENTAIANTGGNIDVADSGSIINLAGSSITGGTVDIHGTLDATGISTIGSNVTVTVESGGILEATGGTLTVTTGHDFTNDGSLIADGAKLVIGDAVHGTGSATVENGGTLEFNSCVSSQQTVEFGAAPESGANVLDLTAAWGFHASITGLALGDTIDLANIAPGSITSAAIDETGTHLLVDVSGYDAPVSINIAGSLTGEHFILQSDASGGSDLVLTENASPTITVPGGQSITAGEETAITSVSIAESSLAPGETFTVTLTDSSGTLGATGGSWSESDHTLTITGTLAQVNNDLRTLVDTQADAGTDMITIATTDSLGSSATEQTIAVNAEASAPTTFSPTDGSAIKTSIFLVAGETVTFDWNFIANDYLPYNDFAFVTIGTTASRTASLLSDVALVGDYGTSGWQTLTFTASANGTYVIGFGQFNDSDTQLNSKLLIDDIRVDGVITDGFTAGSLSGWSSTGNVSVLTTYSQGETTFTAPEDGSPVVVLDSSSSSESTVESFLGLSSGALTTLSEGSFGDPMVIPGTSNVVGDIAFVDTVSADTFATSVTPQGTNYIGSLTLGAVTESNGIATVDFAFTPGSDQINLASGQTLTQSYDIGVSGQSGVSVSQTVSISIGGPGNDNFVFAPGIGTDTIVNFNPQNDTVELDGFANVQTTQQLAVAITSDVHGDAVIELGHGDSVTLPGVTASYLQAHLQSLVHLH